MGAAKLSDGDWNTLVKTVPVVLGTTTIEIKPVGLQEITSLIKSANGIFATMAESGINLSNLEERVLDLVQIISEKAPDLLETLTGIHRDDIARLPLAKGVELLRAVFEVNIADPKALAANMQAIVALIGQFDAGTLTSVAQ